MRVSVIGLGLIGGSFALAMKKRYEDVIVYGWDNDKRHLEEAEKLGLIDHPCHSLQDAIDQGDWIYLSVPVDAIENLLPDLLNKVSANKVIVDFGSTKENICDLVVSHPNRKQYIAAHPIAGTEYSGPGAAFSNLYDDKVMIVFQHQLH